MTKPFFSVVIPTRGRTHVVDWAIRTTLAQTFGDLECVVIDNNDDDRVEKICATFSDSRLRRVKTGGLHMADNLDVAYLNARGVYAILIEDRQCLYRHTLEYIHQQCQREDIQCLLWNNDVFEDESPGAQVHRFGGDRLLRVVRSDDVLEGFCGRKPDQDPMEFILAHRCAVRVDLMEKIRARTGLKICEPVSCDATAGLKFMNELETYHYFHGALSVSHSHQLSNGATFHKNKNATDEFWKHIGGKPLSYAYTSIKACFNENTCFNDYNRLRQVLGERLSQHPVDPFYYYVKLGWVLRESKAQGLDRDEEIAAWQAALAQENPELRQQVETHLKKATQKKWLKEMRVRLGIRRLEQILRRKKAKPSNRSLLDCNLMDFMAQEGDVLLQRDLAQGQTLSV